MDREKENSYGGAGKKLDERFLPGRTTYQIKLDQMTTEVPVQVMHSKTERLLSADVVSCKCEDSVLEKVAMSLHPKRKARQMQHESSSAEGITPTPSSASAAAELMDDIFAGVGSYTAAEAQDESDASEESEVDETTMQPTVSAFLQQLDSFDAIDETESAAAPPPRPKRPIEDVRTPCVCCCAVLMRSSCRLKLSGSDWNQNTNTTKSACNLRTTRSGMA